MRIVPPLMICALVALPGCAVIGVGPDGPGADLPEAAHGGARPMQRPDGETDVQDATQPESDAAPVPAGRLGRTVASLGNPADPGLWLETPLVARQQPGRVTAESGASVEVTLIPIAGDAGAGSRLSLAAMQALGLPLTALAEITVFAGG